MQKSTLIHSIFITTAVMYSISVLFIISNSGYSDETLWLIFLTLPFLIFVTVLSTFFKTKPLPTFFITYISMLTAWLGSLLLVCYEYNYNIFTHPAYPISVFVPLILSSIFYIIAAKKSLRFAPETEMSKPLKNNNRNILTIGILCILLAVLLTSVVFTKIQTTIESKHVYEITDTVNFDGFYLTPYSGGSSYLKFYPDNTVIFTSAIERPEGVASWLNKENKKLQNDIETYELNGKQIEILSKDYHLAGRNKIKLVGNFTEEGLVIEGHNETYGNRWTDTFKFYRDN